MGHRLDRDLNRVPPCLEILGLGSASVSQRRKVPKGCRYSFHATFCHHGREEAPVSRGLLEKLRDSLRGCVQASFLARLLGV